MKNIGAVVSLVGQGLVALMVTLGLWTYSVLYAPENFVVNHPTFFTIVALGIVWTFFGKIIEVLERK